MCMCEVEVTHVSERRSEELLVQRSRPCAGALKPFGSPSETWPKRRGSRSRYIWLGKIDSKGVKQCCIDAISVTRQVKQTDEVRVLPDHDPTRPQEGEGGGLSLKCLGGLR